MPAPGTSTTSSTGSASRRRWPTASRWRPIWIRPASSGCSSSTRSCFHSTTPRSRRGTPMKRSICRSRPNCSSGTRSSSASPGCPSASRTISRSSRACSKTTAGGAAWPSSSKRRTSARCRSTIRRARRPRRSTTSTAPAASRRWRSTRRFRISSSVTS